jgi:peroxiredoxin
MACREELPHLIQLYKQHRGQGLQVVGITQEDADTARKFAKQQQIPYPILTDKDASVFQQFQAESIPHTVLLDKHGRAAGMASGYSTERFAEIELLTEQLLKE